MTAFSLILSGQPQPEAVASRWENAIAGWKNVMESTVLTPSQAAVPEHDNDQMYEVLDDQVVELAPMSAYAVWIATVLTRHLGIFLMQHPLGEAVQEMLFDLSPAMRRKRRPDVAFVSYDRWPRQRRIPHTEAWTVVPNLAVEVISPTDRGEDVLEKMTEYFRVGVECVWVIFPSQAQVYVYTAPTQVSILSRTDDLRGEPALPHFRLPLATLFDDVAETERV